MGSAKLTSVSSVSDSLGLDRRTLRDEVARCFRSELIREPLLRLYDLGYVPDDVVRAIRRGVTFERGLASASP